MRVHSVRVKFSNGIPQTRAAFYNVRSQHNRWKCATRAMCGFLRALYMQGEGARACEMHDHRPLNIYSTRTKHASKYVYCVFIHSTTRYTWIQAFRWFTWLYKPVAQYSFERPFYILESCCIICIIVYNSCMGYTRRCVQHIYNMREKVVAVRSKWTRDYIVTQLAFTRFIHICICMHMHIHSILYTMMYSICARDREFCIPISNLRVCYLCCTKIYTWDQKIWLARWQKVASSFLCSPEKGFSITNTLCHFFAFCAMYNVTNLGRVLTSSVSWRVNFWPAYRACASRSHLRGARTECISITGDL